MDRDETIKILSILRAAYPNAYRDLGKTDLEGIVGLWTTMFRDNLYADVSEAVTDFIASDTKGFPPPIGAIKERVKEKERSMPVFFSVEEDWKRLLAANREGLAMKDWRFAGR